MINFMGYCYLTTTTLILLVVCMADVHGLQQCSDLEFRIRYKLIRKSCRWLSIQEMNIIQHVDIISIKTTALRALLSYEVANIPLLTQLILARCCISTIHEDAFKNATKLENINLSRNNLKILPAGLFVDQWQSLKYLNLEFNQIHAIRPSMFSNLTSLPRLDLDHNKHLVTEPYGFHQVYTEELSISHCEIQYLYSLSFRGVSFKPQTSNLKLSYNNLTVLANMTFSGVSTLARLELSHNKIAIIHPSAFTGLTSLETLDLKNNHLIICDCKIFSPFKNIGQIHLEKNYLVGISQHCPTQFVNSVKVIHLEDNKISSLLNLVSGRSLPWINLGNQVQCEYRLTCLR